MARFKPASTIEGRLRELLEDSKNDLEGEKKTSKRLQALAIDDIDVELGEAINRLRGDLATDEESLAGKEESLQKIEDERTALLELIKDAESWWDEQDLTPTTTEAAQELAEALNEAAVGFFGDNILDTSIYKEQMGDASVQRMVLNGFRDGLEQLKDDLADQDDVRTDLTNEVRSIRDDVAETQTNLDDKSAEADLVVEEATSSDVTEIDDRLAKAPSKDADDEEIIRWLLGDPNQADLGFAKELEELTTLDETNPIPGLPGMRTKIKNVSEGRVYGESGVAARERVERGSDKETLRREYATETEEDFSPEALERDAITTEGDSDEFSPETVRRREQSRVAAEEEGLSAADLARGDESRFLGGAPLEEEPFSPERLRRGATQDEIVAEEEAEEAEEAWRSDVDPASERGGFGAGDASMMPEKPLPVVSNGDPRTLTPAATEYIKENFGSVAFFMDDDRFLIDTEEFGRINIITFLENTEEQNPDVIWGKFQETDWFRDNGPTSRQFQMDWGKAGGTDDWFPQWNDGTDGGEVGWLNMNPDMNELLDDTYDSLIQEAERLGMDTNDESKKEAIMQMAYNARQLNMTEYEMKNEFIVNLDLAFDPNAVKNSGTFGAIRNKLKQNAAAYMIKLDDVSLDQYAQDLYLGKATYEGLNASFTKQAKDFNPAIASLIDQGYTPSAYFSSYANVASNLLGRPVDFMGGDTKMFGALTNTMTGDAGLERPMTRGEFERYVRQTPEWDTSTNARDEAYSTVSTMLDSFGINN